MDPLIIDQLPTLQNIYVGYTIEVRNQQPRLDFDSGGKRHLRRMPRFIVGPKLRS